MTAVLEVNEAKVLATGCGVSWWLDYRSRFERIERIKILTASIGGDRVEVVCDDREHAEWLRGQAVSKGVPRSALKVRVQR